MIYKKILDQDAIQMETQVQRCMLMLDEYFKAQGITIDYQDLYLKLKYPPMLFQLTHLIAFHRMNWRDALRWVSDNKDKIMAYHTGKIDEWGDIKIEQAGSSTAEAN